MYISKETPSKLISYVCISHYMFCILCVVHVCMNGWPDVYEYVYVSKIQIISNIKSTVTLEEHGCGYTLM